MKSIVAGIRLNLLIQAIIGAIIGSAFAGLIEAIVKTLIKHYDRWTLPVTAIGYYGFLGLLAGIGLGILINLLLLFSFGAVKPQRVFSISAAAMATYFILRYFVFRLQSLLGFDFRNIGGFLLFGLIIMLFFGLIFFLVNFSYSTILKRFRKPLMIYVGIYLAALAFSGIVAAASPPIQRQYKPYDPASAAKVAEKPSVVFILIDALRYDWISPYGYNIKTPGMQSLADDGVLFTNAFANSNWTKSAVSSIFTSLIPRSHGITGASSMVPDNLPILADEMSQAGYYSIGFSTNPLIQEITRFDRGFNEFHYLKSISAIPIDQDAPLLTFDLEIRTILRNLIPPLKKREFLYSDAQRTTDRVIEWLKANGQRKFFMYLHYMDTHGWYYRHPYNGEWANPDDPTGEKLGYYSELYKGEIVFADEHLSRLLAFLRESGIYDSSLVFLTADHGEEFFEHYHWEHRTSMFDEQIHIPLIIKMPGQLEAGTVDSSLASEIDFAPTILSHVGLAIPDSWQGKDILSPDYHRDCVISQSERMGYNIMGARTLNGKWIETDPGYSVVRLGRNKLKQMDSRAAFPEKNLFDLTADPREKNNLYGQVNHKAFQDSLLALTADALASMSKIAVASENATFDEETVRNLKGLGYLK